MEIENHGDARISNVEADHEGNDEDSLSNTKSQDLTNSFTYFQSYGHQ
jgi:hypothetical protein